MRINDAMHYAKRCLLAQERYAHEIFESRIDFLASSELYVLSNKINGLRKDELISIGRSQCNSLQAAREIASHPKIFALIIGFAVAVSQVTLRIIHAPDRAMMSRCEAMVLIIMLAPITIYVRHELHHRRERHEIRKRQVSDLASQLLRQVNYSHERAGNRERNNLYIDPSDVRVSPFYRSSFYNSRPKSPTRL